MVPLKDIIFAHIAIFLNANAVFLIFFLLFHSPSWLLDSHLIDITDFFLKPVIQPNFLWLVCPCIFLFIFLYRSSRKLRRTQVSPPWEGLISLPQFWETDWRAWSFSSASRRYWYQGDTSYVQYPEFYVSLLFLILSVVSL